MNKLLELARDKIQRRTSWLDELQPTQQRELFDAWARRKESGIHGRAIYLAAKDLYGVKCSISAFEDQLNERTTEKSVAKRNRKTGSKNT